MKSTTTRIIPVVGGPQYLFIPAGTKIKGSDEAVTAKSDMTVQLYKTEPVRSGLSIRAYYRSHRGLRYVLVAR